jgi:hypothetical protein
MFEFLGTLERIMADLYPYRVPLTVGALVVAAVAVTIAWRAGWVRRVWAFAAGRPITSGVAVIVALAVVLPTGWYLASPLWTRVELIEASPLEMAAQAGTPAIPTTPAAPDSTQPMAGEPEDGDATSDAEAEFVPGVVRSGMWVGADAFHFAQGDALIIETEPGRYVLRVENFSVRNGPDLFMYLSPDPDGYAEGGLNLGTLRATDGAFNYDIPEGADLSAYQSVVVWCERFAVLFATATLQEGPPADM